MSLFSLLVVYPLAALGALQIVWVGRHLVYMYWPRNWPRFGIIPKPLEMPNIPIRPNHESLAVIALGMVTKQLYPEHPTPAEFKALNTLLNLASLHAFQMEKAELGPSTVAASTGFISVVPTAAATYGGPVFSHLDIKPPEFFWCDHCGRGRVEDGGGHYSDCPLGACKHPSRVQPQGLGPIYCRLCGVEVDSL